MGVFTQLKMGFHPVLANSNRSILPYHYSPTITFMKPTVQRGWQFDRPVRKIRSTFDMTTAIGSLTVALLAYIIYHIYPLVSLGLFW
ncbi:hypothetical protein GCM10028807_46800 [Spirosoma daeguense]